MMLPAGRPRVIGQHSRSLIQPPTCHPAASAKQLPSSRCCSGPGTLEVWTTVDIQHPRFEVRQWSDQVLVKEASTPAAAPDAPQSEGQQADGAAQPGAAAADRLHSDAPRPTSVLQKLQHQAFVRKSGRAPGAAAAVAVQEAPLQQVADPEQAAGLQPVADAASPPGPSAAVAEAPAGLQVQQAQQEAAVAAAVQPQQQQQQAQQQQVLSKQKPAKCTAVQQQQQQRRPRLPVARLLQPLAHPTPLALQAPGRQDISRTAATVCEHMHQGRSVLFTADDASAVSKALYVAAAARVLQQARHGTSLALRPSWLGDPPAAPSSSAATPTSSSSSSNKHLPQQQQQVAAAGLQLQVLPAAEHLLRYRPGTTLHATRESGSWGRLVAPLATQLQSGGSATLRAAGAGALHNALAAAAAVQQRFQGQGVDVALVPRYQVMSQAEWRAGSRAGRAAAAAQLVAEGVAGPVADGDDDADEPFSALLLQVVLVAPSKQQQPRRQQQQQKQARKPGRSKSRVQVAMAQVPAAAAAVVQPPVGQPPAVVRQRELVLAA